MTNSKLNILLYLVPYTGESYLDLLQEHPDVRIQNVLVAGKSSEPLDSFIDVLEEREINHRIEPDLDAPETREWLKASDYHLGICTGYHEKLPDWLIELPEWETINLHHSLLPRYRGPRPMFWVLRNQERETGVTLHYMNDRLDAGPIINQRSFTISTNDTLYDLLTESNAHGFILLKKLFEQTAAHQQPPEASPQPPEASPPYAPEVQKEHLYIQWDQTGKEIDALVRAAFPFFGARLTMEDTEIRVNSIDVIKDYPGRELNAYEPGDLVQESHGPLVRCANRWILLKQIQISENAMTGEQFQKEHQQLMNETVNLRQQ